MQQPLYVAKYEAMCSYYVMVLSSVTVSRKHFRLQYEDTIAYPNLNNYQVKATVLNKLLRQVKLESILKSNCELLVILARALFLIVHLMSDVPWSVELEPIFHSSHQDHY